MLGTCTLNLARSASLREAAEVLRTDHCTWWAMNLKTLPKSAVWRVDRKGRRSKAKGRKDICEK